jgi:hypothetical protein
MEVIFTMKAIARFLYVCKIKDIYGKAQAIEKITGLIGRDYSLVPCAMPIGIIRKTSQRTGKYRM